MKVYMTGHTVGGSELYDWPTKAYSSLEKAQRSFGEDLPWVKRASDAVWVAERDWPRPIICELELDVASK